MNTILRRTQVDRAREPAPKEANNQIITWGLEAVSHTGAGYSTGESRRAFAIRAIGLTEVAAVDAYLGGAIAVLKDGRLFMWGGNGFGELGLGDRRTRNVPTQVTALASTPVAEASGAGGIILARLGSGECRAWGGGVFGQQGAGDAHGSAEPAPVETAEGVHITNVVGISAGGHNCAFIVEETPGTPSSRRIYSTGGGPFKPTPTAYARPLTAFNAGLVSAGVYPTQVACSGNVLVVLCSDGKVRTAGNNSGTGPGAEGPRSMNGLWGTGVVGEPGELEAGTKTQKLAKAQGEREVPHVVKRLNSEGALVDLANIVSVSASIYHVLALEARTEGGKGRVYAWGNNDLGQCGSGTPEENVIQASPVELPYEATPPSFLENVVAIAAAGTTGAAGSTGEVGTQWSTALLAAGEIVNWGGNKDGELGNLSAESGLPSIEPVKLSAIPVLYNDVVGLTASEGLGVAIIARATEAVRTTSIEPGPEPGSVRLVFVIDTHDRVENLDIEWRRVQNAPSYPSYQAHTGPGTNAKGELNEIVLDEEPVLGSGFAAINSLLAAWQARRALGEEPEGVHINDHNHLLKVQEIPKGAVIVAKGKEPNSYLIAIESKGAIVEGGFLNSKRLLETKTTWVWSRGAGTIGLGATQSVAITIAGGGQENWHNIREWKSTGAYEPGDEVIEGVAGSGPKQQKESEVPKDVYRCLHAIKSATKPSADATHWQKLPAKAQMSFHICPAPERGTTFTFTIRNLPLPALWPDGTPDMEVSIQANFAPAQVKNSGAAAEKLTAVLAPVWSASATYTLGTELVWQNALYKCIKAVTVAGPEPGSGEGATYWKVVRAAAAGVNRYLLAWPNQLGGGGVERGEPYESSHKHEAGWRVEGHRLEPFIPISAYGKRSRTEWKPGGGNSAYIPGDVVEVEAPLTCTASTGSCLLTQSAGPALSAGQLVTHASLPANAIVRRVIAPGQLYELNCVVASGGISGTVKAVFQWVCLSEVPVSNFRGAWAGVTAYALNDSVETGGGNYYRCIKAMSAGEDVAPPEATHWAVIPAPLANPGTTWEAAKTTAGPAVYGGIWSNSKPVGTLTSELSASVVTNTLAVTPLLAAAVKATGSYNFQLEVNDGAGHSHRFTVGTTAERGATSVTLNGDVAGFAYPIGTPVRIVGARAFQPGEVVVNEWEESPTITPEEAYVCVSAVASSGIEPHLDVGVFKGAWVAAAAYSVGDSVTNGGVLYRCIKAMTTGEDVAPPEATHWVATKWVPETVFGKLTAHEKSQTLIGEAAGSGGAEVLAVGETKVYRSLGGTPAHLASEPLLLTAKGHFENLFGKRFVELRPPGEPVAPPQPLEPPRMRVVFPPGTPAGTTRPFFKKGGVGPCTLVVENFGTWTDEEAGMTRTFEWMSGPPTEQPGWFPLLGASGSSYTIQGITTGGSGTQDTGAAEIANPALHEMTLRVRERVRTAAGAASQWNLSEMSYCIQS